jgi:hypothetical protein
MSRIVLANTLRCGWFLRSCYHSIANLLKKLAPTRTSCCSRFDYSSAFGFLWVGRRKIINFLGFSQGPLSMGFVVGFCFSIIFFRHQLDIRDLASPVTDEVLGRAPHPHLCEHHFQFQSVA